MMNSFLGLATAALLTTVSSTASLASSLKITDAEGASLAVFDREKIEAIGMESIKTATPWTEGIAHFEGSPLKEVLSLSGVAGKDVTALAFDDYAVSITAETIAKYEPIIATRLNGTQLTVDDKGPFWIIFDFDNIPEETSVELRAFAVWHLAEFEVE
jgi:hypothetical protein